MGSRPFHPLAIEFAVFHELLVSSASFLELFPAGFLGCFSLTFSVKCEDGVVVTRMGRGEDIFPFRRDEI